MRLIDSISHIFWFDCPQYNHCHSPHVIGIINFYLSVSDVCVCAFAVFIDVDLRIGINVVLAMVVGIELTALIIM